MKIGVYLINIHHTFLNDFIKVLEPGKNEVHLFVSEKIYNLLAGLSPETLSKTKYIPYPGKNINSYNMLVSRLSNNLDCLIISPNSGRKGIISHLFLNPRCPYLFIDVLFGDVFLNVYGFFKWDAISNYLYKSIYKKIMFRSSGIIYSSIPLMKIMKQYVNKPSVFFPFNFYDSLSAIPPAVIPRSGKTVFTITGTLEQKRKNLSVFFDALDILLTNREFKKEAVQFVLLGGLLSKDNQYGKNCILKAEEYNKLFGSNIIITFNEIFISETEYRKWIGITDLILNAINVRMYKYGKFCSGMAESISYSLPGIYPSEYDTLEELSNSSLKFSDAGELAGIIISVSCNNDYLRELTNNARINSQHFSIDNYRKKIFPFINDTCLTK